MERLVALGYEVHAVAPLDPTYDDQSYIKRIESLGVKFHTVTMLARSLSPISELSSVWSIFQVLRKIRPDVLLSFTVKCNLYGGLCRNVLRFEQIANIPGLGEVFGRRDFIYRIVCGLYRLAFRGTKAALFQNQSDLDYCVDNKLVTRRICFLIPGSGVDLGRFEQSNIPLKPGKRTFLMFGRLLPQKGYPLFILAAREMKRLAAEAQTKAVETLSTAVGSSPVSHWQAASLAEAEFIVQGIQDYNRPESGDLVRDLEIAAESGVLTLMPSAVDVRPILAQADVVVLPSVYNEGIPRSLLEALASGKVIITSNWKGCRETVVDGQNGFLMPNVTDQDLIQTMLRVCQMSDDELAQMGRESRKLVEARFDEEIVIERYLQLISPNDPMFDHSPAPTVDTANIASRQAGKL